MCVINEQSIEEFRKRLYEDEKARATISKYMCDLRKLMNFADGSVIDRSLLVDYKEYLASHYKLTSANSMIAAANLFFKMQGWNDYCMKPFRIQRESFRENSRELSRDEYLRLISAAGTMGKSRIKAIMETICSTGIRVGELKYITVEAVKQGSARITLKGKTRTVLMVPKLCRMLMKVIKRQGISSGPVFITRTGRPVDRSNILHEMKSLYKEAGVERTKIFPHNLRHLFAVTYYKIEKDLAHLADILGHSNINTTRIYTATSKEEQIKVMERMRFVLT